MTQPMNILLLSRHQEDREDLKHCLASGDFKFEVCIEVADLRPEIDHFILALVVVEPDGEGLEYVRGLRNQYSHDRLPILALADNQVALLEQIFAAGADQIVPMASEPPAIRAIVHARARQQQQVEQLHCDKDRLRRAIEGCRDGLWDWNLDNDRVFYSWEWRVLLGLPPGDDITSPNDWFSLVHPDDLAPLRSRLAVHIEGVTPSFECQCRMKVMGSRYKWMLVRGAAERNEHNKAKRITGTLTDLSNRSHHDVRTGLPFRSFFVDRLNQAILQAQLAGNKLYSVLHIEVDRFTAISEGFGHDMVDALVVSFAHRIESCLNDGDTLAFLGGNAFVIMLEDNQDMKVAREVANQIHMQLIAPFRVSETEVFTKASIGITRVDGKLGNASEILQQAHNAMKAARQSGSGHTQVFDQAMAGKVRELINIETGLRSALDQEQFELHYQPQVCLQTGKIIGLETLLRWKLDGKYISPGKFIPVAEETDLILTIGEWVLRRACQQAVKWQESGLPPMRIAVNLSERQFRARNLVGMVDQVLRDTGLKPEHLELEITESIFMEDIESTLIILKNLRKRGIKIALDDFGTGFSSLSYLKRFPLTTLKIDRAFVTDLTTDAGDAAICSTIISLAHKFGFSVIAEGVEKKEQLIILRAFQCDEIQGFYFSKALPPDELEQLVAKQTKKLLARKNISGRHRVLVDS